MILFFKSRIKYFNFFLEIQNNDLLIHLLTYLFLLWIQQVVYIILKNSGKSFTGSVNLKRHKCRVHEGHKDHKCESWEKSFSEAAKLKIHIHTVYKGYRDSKCDSCAKSFTKLQCLKKHIHFSQAGHSRNHIYTIYTTHKCAPLFSCKFLEKMVKNIHSYTLWRKKKHRILRILLERREATLLRISKQQALLVEALHNHLLLLLLYLVVKSSPLRREQPRQRRGPRRQNLILRGLGSAAAASK